jgi:hypothetical protein
MNTFVSTARSSFHPLPQKGCLYTQVLGWLAMRMDKRGSGQDDRGHGSKRGNRPTSHPVGVGDRPWVISTSSGRQISSKSFGMMVARDGVEPPTPAFSGLRTTSLSTWLFNNLTLRSGPSFVTTL